MLEGIHYINRGAMIKMVRFFDTGYKFWCI